MKVQWQLIDIESGKKYASLGESFDLIPELFKEKWKRLWHGKDKRSGEKGERKCQYQKVLWIDI